MPSGLSSPRCSLVSAQILALQKRQLIICLLFSSDIEDDLMHRPAPLSDLGPWFQPGQTGRLQRRYMKQPLSSIFDLSHSLFGRHQIAALVEFLLLEKNAVEELRLENNAIDDNDLAILINGLKRRGGKLRRLNVAHNRLTSASIECLVPLLKVRISIPLQI